ncbi:MAG: hypothetical protein AAGB29_04285 [Planctomycetota bacterium]
MPYFDRVQTFGFFVSPARSGHSVIGQLLSAHPDIIFSDELGVVTKIDEGYSADQVFALIRAQDLHLQNRGRAKSGYDYRVDGAWQNVTDKHPVAIGDAKGARASAMLAADPAFADKIRSCVGVPIRAIVHLRDPFDIVGSRVKRRGRKLDDAIFGMRGVHDSVVAALATLREEERLIQYHEDVIADPVTAFERMFAFLGVEPNDQAVQACAGKLWARPHAARKATDWPEDAVARLRGLIDESPILGRYADPPVTDLSGAPVAPAGPTPAGRPREDDQTGYFDRVERFTLMLSPQARGCGKLALTLSQHPDLLISNELSDELDRRGCLLAPLSRGQLLAILKHQSFRQLARQRKVTDDKRRSGQVYRAIQDRSPTSMGAVLGEASIHAIAKDPGLLDELADRLGVPLRVVCYFRPRRLADRFRKMRPRPAAVGQSLEASMRAIYERFDKQDRLVVSFDELSRGPSKGFDDLFGWLGVGSNEAALEACIRWFDANPKTYAARKPWWLQPAQAVKRRVKRFRGQTGKTGPRA